MSVMFNSPSSVVPRITQDVNGAFPSPYSVDPLPGHLRVTLLPVAIMALASFLSTLFLVCFITYRMVAWRKYYRVYPGYNQYLLLIYNLVLADFQQSIAFLLSFHWIKQNNILAPTAACFIQGWLVQVGDVSSGMWVLAIAIHTWYSVRGRKLEHFRFCCCLISVWVFVFILAVIGPIAHPKSYFVNTGAWCWINQDYTAFRLYLHYVWILGAQFGCVVIYAFVFLLLRHRMQQVIPASRSTNSNKIARAARFMVLYPIAYVAFSLPLPAGRLAVWSGRKVSLTYYCAAATLMTSCGFVDTILYTLTRRVLVNEIGNGSAGSIEPTGSMRGDRSSINMGIRMKKGQGLNPEESTEDILNIVKTETYEVVSESVHTQERSCSMSIRED